MTGIAAGLSTCGKVPFISSFAMFAAGRNYEQVRNSIGYPHLNVKIGATHAGISVGEDGATHQCLEDLALMRGINDQAEHAKLLAKRLNHYGDNWAHVNPIPLNPIEGSRWTASKPEDEQQFLDILHKAGITATLRDTRGQDIDGACGQLAAKEQD